MVLTGRAAAVVLGSAVVVALLVASGGSAVTLLLVVNALLLLLLVADVVLAGSPAAVSLARSGQTRCRLGEAAQVQLRVRNDGGRRLRAVVRDAWVPTARAVIAGGGIPQAAGATDRARIDLAPGMSVTLDVLVRPSRRGDRPADRVTIRSFGPLGLAGRQRSVAAPWSVRTLPAFASRRHLPSRLARLRDLDGRSVVAVRAAGSEFDSLREYVPGDDVRSIDWRASARADDVIVRTWRPERDRRILIVIDTGRTCAARVGDETRLDVLIDAALLLAALAGKAGDRVELMAHDRRTTLHVRAGAGTEVLSSLADALATTEPQLVETDYRGLVASVLSRLSKRAFVVVLTSLERPAMEEGLLPALPVLTSRHTVMVGAVSQPAPEGERALTMRRGSAPAGAAVRVAAAAGPIPGVSSAAEAPDVMAGAELGEPLAAPERDDAGVTGTYHRAALARERREREWTAAALARLGVRVVDAPPDQLAPRLADAYLDLKASGRL